jgi:hypothetical protein
LLVRALVDRLAVVFLVAVFLGDRLVAVFFAVVLRVAAISVGSSQNVTCAPETGDDPSDERETGKDR